MKIPIINGIIISATALLAPQILPAQGTITYLSNLGQKSIGTNSVANDSWFAAGFSTGNNTGGYTLNSIQLAMADASGNPNSFTLMLYSLSQPPNSNFDFPGSSLGTLNGSLNPATAGTYTYNAPSNLTLSSDTIYFVVLTAGTAVANGAYELSFASTGSFSIYNPSGGWMAPAGFIASDLYQSSNGLDWNFARTGAPQYAINATPIPEPTSSFLLLLGSGVFIYVRRTVRR